MPILFIISSAIALFFAIHAVRNGREIFWLFILFMFPFLGSLVYAFAVFLPELRNAPKVRKVQADLVEQMDPGRDVRLARERFDDLPTVQNRFELAQALLASGNAQEAVTHLQACLFGPHDDDTAILQALATSQLAAGDGLAALATLDRLRAAHPKYQSAEAHLVYARALEKTGQLAEAEGEYRILVDYYPGVEPECRLGMLLRQLGRENEARACFAQVKRQLERAPRNVRDSQRHWLDLVRREQ
jgi:hypothetical protein